MGNLGQALEKAEIALCELTDALRDEGWTARKNEIARISRMISSWRNEE